MSPRDVNPTLDEINRLYVAESVMPRQTVEAIKADLLKIPASAYARALHAYNALKQDPHPDNDQIALYAEVVDSLRADGYAPDPETGAQGPATKAYYENQVLGTDLPPPGSPAPVVHASASSLSPELPDPYIE